MPQDVPGQNVVQTAYESLRELGEMNTRLLQRLSEQQQTVLRLTMEAGARQAQLLSQPASYQNLPGEQAALAGEYNNRLLEVARRTADILRETQDEFAAWVRRGMERATSTAGAATSTGSEAPSAGRKRRS